MEDVNTINQPNSNYFESLCNKIACIVYDRTKGDKKILSKIIDSLNDLDYYSFPIKKEKGVLLINQCCFLISPDEILLTSKAVTLFTNLITKALITVEGKTLPLVVAWCLECLKHGNEILILKCLQGLLKGNGKKIENQIHQILCEMEKLSNNFALSCGSEEICLNCLRCIEAITSSSEPKVDMFATDILLDYFNVFRKVLFNGKTEGATDEILYCKYFIIAIRGISNVIQMSEDILKNNLGDILGIVKGYMLYGLEGHDNCKIQKLYPTSTTIPEIINSSQQVRKLCGKYEKRSKKVTVSCLSSVEEADDLENKINYLGLSENQEFLQSGDYKTSDSEVSDSELSQNSKIKSYESKVRHCSLILLATIIQKTNPKVFIAYIPCFLPDGCQFKHMRTLITCLLEDISPKCRSEVLGILLMIITNSRHYFQQADGISKSSFTSFSCTISNIIKELHRCLLISLKTEKNNTTIKRLLKCISDLICCTPYHKLESGLIRNIGTHVKMFLRHKDVAVQIFTLTIFGRIVSIEPKVEEVLEVLFTGSGRHRKLKEEQGLENGTGEIVDEIIIDDLDEVYEKVENINVKEKSWLLEQCLQNLIGRKFNSSTNVALQIESLQVVGALSRNFFKETVVDFHDDLIQLLKYCLSKSEYTIRLYAGKLMETIFNSLQFNICQEDESTKAPISLAVRIWESLLPGPVAFLFQSQEPMLRCTGCDCIANIGIKSQNNNISSVQNSLIFDQLPRDKQIMCITLLFGCLRDESPAVRSSAARAMAFFVLFPSLREDNLFLLDTVDTAILLAGDSESTVRTQASWLFGNLSEAIVINNRKGIDNGISLDLFARLIKTGIKLMDDSPKIKPGAQRGIGNLLQIENEDFFKEYKDVVVEGLDALIKNATVGTFMKARWNSCYAIANVLQNSLINGNGEWMTKIFNVMISLVQHHKNFKVRISAGLVLEVPPTRKSYGDLYNSVWAATLNALENSKNISDFNEYQHRDQLVDQLCLVMCHLVSIIELSDLSSLQDVLYFHLDNLSNFMTKFHERIIPEKSDVLLSAAAKVHLLMNSKGLSVEDKSLLRVLKNLFGTET